MSRFRLLVLNPTCLDVIEQHRAWIESEGVELLADQSNRELDANGAMRLLGEADAVILPAAIRSFPSAEQMASSTRLRVCSIAASGHEWLDVPAATREGIVVTFAPGGDGAEVVADMAWALMLAVARQIPHHHQLVCNGSAERGMGTGVYGKTLGLIGLGNIGKATARRARGFGMTVFAADPFPDEQFARANDLHLVDKDELLQKSVFISLHVRLDEHTRHMIGQRELRMMKPTAFLINTARKELVDEAALVTAIREGWIAGAGLDDPPGVAAKALCGLPNVIFTPHLGNRAIEGVHGVFKRAVENCLAVLQGQKSSFVVNPEVFEHGVRRAMK